MELRHLRYFVAVAETLNYRRAAERLHVSQPALSKQIRHLEEAIGAQLFYRNTSGVALTPAGAVLLDDARDVLERVEMAAASAREAEAGCCGHLVIGSLGGLSAGVLPPALTVFRTKFPRVELSLQEASVPDQMRALGTGSIQVAFAIGPGIMVSPNLESTEVLVSRMAVAVARKHRLARQRSISLIELVNEPVLCVSDNEQRGGVHRELVEAVFATRGIRHRPVKCVNSMESLMTLVAGAHGVSILLPVMSPKGGNGIAFRRIKEDGDDLAVHLLAVWRKDRDSRLSRNFVDVLRSCSPARSPQIR